MFTTENIKFTEEDIKNLFWQFIGFISISNFRKVIKDGIIYPAVSIPKIPLRFLLRYKEYEDSEIYFKTTNNKIFRIFKYRLQNVFTWAIDSNDVQLFNTHFFMNEKLANLKLEVGKIFQGTNEVVIEGQITEIVLTRKVKLKWRDIIDLKLKESEIVTEFNSSLVK